jgi:hypothetical protein
MLLHSADLVNVRNLTGLYIAPFVRAADLALDGEVCLAEYLSTCKILLVSNAGTSTGCWLVDLYVLNIDQVILVISSRTLHYHGCFLLGNTVTMLPFGGVGYCVSQSKDHN